MWKYPSLKEEEKIKKAFVLTDGPCFLFTVPDHTTMISYCLHPNPNGHTLFTTLSSFCKNVFNICLPLAPGHFHHLSVARQWLPPKDNLEAAHRSVLSICFPLSINDKWQPQVDGNKSFFRSKPEEETYTHTHTKKNPEKHWKLKNNHFRRQKKKPEHFKQIMAPWTKPPCPEGNFTI